MLNQNFINDKDLEKYGMKKRYFYRTNSRDDERLFARQNEIMMNILAAHEISEKDMIAYGSKQIKGRNYHSFLQRKTNS